MNDEVFDFDVNSAFSYSIDVAAKIYKNINSQEEANKLFLEQIELFFKNKGRKYSCSESNRIPYFDEIIYKNDEQKISILIEKNGTKSVKTITFSTIDAYSVKLVNEGFHNKCLFGLPIFTMQWFDEMNAIFIHFIDRESYLKFDTPQGRMEKELFGFEYNDVNYMQDLVLKSTHHQRYQNGVPVMGSQYCNRTIKIENKVFKEMFNGLDVTPKEGFLVTMWNMDMPTPTQQMQPKLMEMVADTGDKISLRGVTLKAMGVVAYDNKDYGITLHLKNRNVVKCVLHLYDRGVDIEYDELIK